MNHVSYDDELTFEDDAALDSLDGDFAFADDAEAYAWEAPQLEDAPVEMHDPVQPASVPERVRFAVPATLRTEGRPAIEVAGVVLNLSVMGVACQAPLDLVRGQRVWLEFSLALGEPPVSLLAQVVWRKELYDGQILYGLYFCSLTQDERTHIGATVRERSEGRAGAWPMPLSVPADESDAASVSTSWSARQASMVAGVSFLAGMGLAFLLAVLATAVNGGSPPESMAALPPPIEAHQIATAAALAEGAASLSLAEQPALADPSSPADDAVASTSERMPEDQSKTSDASGAQQLGGKDLLAESATTAAAQTTEQEGLLPKKQPLTTQGAATEEGILRPLGHNELRLALLTDGPAHDVKTFWLANPTRLVVDAPGRKSAFARIDYGVEHPLASRLRVGHHPDKVRFVIETVSDIHKDVRIEKGEEAVIVILNRRPG